MSVWLWNMFLGLVDVVILVEVIMLFRHTRQLQSKLDEFNHVRVVQKVKKKKCG